MIGIYKITSPSNRSYIGQSIDIDRRFRFYKNINCKGQPILYSSLLKYGVDSHTFEVIEECLLDELNIKERYWQEYYDVLKNGLNCNMVDDDIKPKVYSQNTKDKISKSLTGKPKSLKHKENLSKNKLLTTNGSDNSFYGKKHTENFKLDRSIKRTGDGNPNAKLVLNLETGIYYGSCVEASKTCNIKYDNLKGWLSGLYINKSSFIYI